MWFKTTVCCGFLWLLLEVTLSESSEALRRKHGASRQKRTIRQGNPEYKFWLGYFQQVDSLTGSTSFKTDFLSELSRSQSSSKPGILEWKNIKDLSLTRTGFQGYIQAVERTPRVLETSLSNTKPGQVLCDQLDKVGDLEDEVIAIRSRQLAKGKAKWEKASGKLKEQLGQSYKSHKAVLDVWVKQAALLQDTVDAKCLPYIRN